jgi:hypothetical protein
MPPGLAPAQQARRVQEPGASLQPAQYPALPSAELAELAKEAGQTEGNARKLELLAQRAALRMRAAGAAQWPQAPEYGERSPEDLELSLKLVSLRGKAAVLRAILDGVLYPAPEWVEERLAEVTDELALKAQTQRVGGEVSEGAEEKASQQATQEATSADAEAAAEGARHSEAVAAALTIDLGASPGEWGVDSGAVWALLRRRSADVERALSRALERVKQ